MNMRIYSGRIALASGVSTLPVPTSSSDGVAVPASSSGMRPDAFVLFFASESVEAVIQGPVTAHAYDADAGRWFVAGILNESSPIDAVAGLELDIVWRGAERIDVSAPGITGGGTVTITAVPVVTG